MVGRSMVQTTTLQGSSPQSLVFRCPPNPRFSIPGRAVRSAPPLEETLSLSSPSLLSPYGHSRVPRVPFSSSHQARTLLIQERKQCLVCEDGRRLSPHGPSSGRAPDEW